MHFSLLTIVTKLYHKVEYCYTQLLVVWLPNGRYKTPANPGDYHG